MHPTPAGRNTSAGRISGMAGFTVVELMIAVAIIGIMAGIAIPNYLDYVDKARIVRAIAEIRYISRAVDAYEAFHDELPATLADAGAGGIVDPWGNPYEYFNIVAWAAGGPGNGGGGGNGGGNNGGAGGAGGGNNGGAGGAGGGGGNGGGNKTGYWFSPSAAYAAAGGVGKPRKDRFLHPINSDYDLYSMGKDGESVEPLTAKNSQDDIIRANDGAFVGLAKQF